MSFNNKQLNCHISYNLSDTFCSVTIHIFSSIVISYVLDMQREYGQVFFVYPFNNILVYHYIQSPIVVFPTNLNIVELLEKKFDLIQSQNR